MAAGPAILADKVGEWPLKAENQKLKITPGKHGHAVQRLLDSLDAGASADLSELPIGLRAHGPPQRNLLTPCHAARPLQLGQPP
jgi:hypothetical protein